jgi:hypothetical protein
MKKMYTPQGLAFSICGLFLILSFSTFAQVGIGNTNPNDDSLLEIGDATTTTKGLLLPRVNLVNTSNFAPMTAHVQGMVVFNKNTTGDVTPGYYYNDGTQWVRLATDAPNNDWGRWGNAGTVAGTNFLGTTDDIALRIKTTSFDRFEVTNGTTQANGGRLRAFTNGDAATPIYSWNDNVGTGMFQAGADILGFSTNTNERMRIMSNGQIIVNNTAPFAASVFSSFAGGTNNSIASSAVNGYALYGQASGEDGNGAAVINTDEDGVGLIAAGGGAGLAVLPGTGATITGDGIGGASFAEDTAGTGFAGVGNGSITARTLTNGSGLAGAGDTGVYGYSTTAANGTGLIGVGNNNTIVGVLGLGSGVAGTGSQFGVYGRSTSQTANEIFGGVFTSEFSGLAFVGGWNGLTRYKIMGNGTVSTIVKDVKDEPIIMFAPEAPEILLQDYGVGKLSNGTARIKIDPNLSKNIRVDDKHPLKVFVTLEGDCNGIYVTNKSANEFTVKELQNGKSNVSFSWSIVATRADEKITNKNGEVRISNNSVRFPALSNSFNDIEQEIVKESKKIKSNTQNTLQQIDVTTKDNTTAPANAQAILREATQEREQPNVLSIEAAN